MGVERETLRGVGGGEIIIRIYYMKKNHFNRIKYVNLKNVKSPSTK